jgi:cytochrome c553|tara:strand:- start:117 stop:563 length:447 start_codon:yes stop_codon:yes gene_type:complete
MKELGMALFGASCILGFFAFVIYPDLEYTGGQSISSCTGECYVEYVKLHGTPAEIEQRKRALAEGDPFSNIRSLWAGCAACHGNNGGGGVGPALAGQTSDYIIEKLTIYRNGGEVGPQSALMWGQASMLSEDDIKTIGEFVQSGFPSK